MRGQLACVPQLDLQGDLRDLFCSLKHSHLADGESQDRNFEHHLLASEAASEELETGQVDRKHRSEAVERCLEEKMRTADRKYPRVLVMAHLLEV